MGTGSEKYVIASIAKTHKIQGEMPANFQIDTFTRFCIIDTEFDACRDYRSPPAGSPGAPREPLGAHLTTFDKYIKNAKI